jgi:hypothetical protein
MQSVAWRVEGFLPGADLWSDHQQGIRICVHCQSCGFTFRDRSRLETPSRCPRCKRERIDEPLFRIESIGSGAAGGG